MNGSAAGEAPATRPARSGRLAGLAGLDVLEWSVLAVSILPVVAAVVRRSGTRWIPIGDNALVEMRARDVFSVDHVPLLGTWSSASLSAGKDLNHPGPLLFDLLAAGANRVDRVSFHSSVLQEKRAEARVLAVRAARIKAEAMATELGQTLGEPLRIDEAGTPSPWQAPSISNYVMNNDSAAQLGETMATGKISVHAGVSVVFRLRGA